MSQNVLPYRLNGAILSANIVTSSSLPCSNLEDILRFIPFSKHPLFAFVLQTLISFLRENDTGYIV